MAHHFDTDRAKEDPQLNCCDFYLFQGKRDTTVMAMTVGADAGLSSQDVFHPEGLYVFRFDTDGDAKEDVVFKFRFSEPGHMKGEEHKHRQSFQVARAVGADIPEDRGQFLVHGEMGFPTVSKKIRAFAGIVPDLWASDATAFRAAIGNLLTKNIFDPKVFETRQNLFKNRNIMAIVLEVPNSLIGQGLVNAWATISLFGHAPEVQISRFGIPLMSYLFLAAASDLRLTYHETGPSDDERIIAPAVAAFVERLSRSAGAISDPAAYGRAVSALVCPSMLSYVLGTPAEFTASRFNGRALTDDAYDAMWSLAAGTLIRDGVAPDPSRTQPDFPYYGQPYSFREQAGLEPLLANFRKNRASDAH